MQKLREKRDHLNVHGRNMETESPACQIASQQVGKIDVGRRIAYSPGRSCFALELRIHSSLTIYIGRNKMLPSCKLATMILGIILSRHRKREMMDISVHNWIWLVGSEGMGVDETTLIEIVEPSSFGASGGRLLVHLSNSQNTACPGQTRASTHSSNVPVEEP